MSRLLAHRGPDDEGYFVNGEIGFGHRRLSIIDLKKGRQPICNEDETVWIVYNGEIYNYKKLRGELEEKGHHFKTDSDTEVIVHLYEEHGEGCLDRLNGMFSFAIWDQKSRKLFLARDRIGQKPLFYREKGENFVFASEVKAILADDGADRDIDFEAVNHYLSLRFIPAPLSMFRGIKKLPAGHYLVFQDGKVRVSRYWDFSFLRKLHFSGLEDYADALNEKLVEVIDEHLVSDVPVGAFLSGGLDSSTIVAIMGKILPGRFKTFSIGVKEQDYNELPFARMVAKKYNTEHVERVVEADLIRLLPKMVWHLDEPSDPIASCMLHAAKLASEHVKVVLGGDGGDELFGGFDRYLGVGFVDYYTYLPPILRQKIIGSVINSIPDSFTYKSLAQKLKWMHHLSEYEGGERYAQATTFFRFTHEGKAEIFNDGLWDRLKHIRSTDIIVEQFNKTNAENPIDKMLYADFMTRLSEHTLMLTDRMNMAHSLEARSPYLDHTLVEFLASFPNEMKVRRKTLKYILRTITKDYLPPEIVNRKKQGFMFPVAYWFKNELHDFLRRFLLDSRIIREGFFKRESVEQLIIDHRQNREDNHVRLWMLLNLEVWHQIYLEGKDLGALEENILQAL